MHRWASGGAILRPTSTRVSALIILALALGACAEDQPVEVETERRPALDGDFDGAWPLARGARLVQVGGALSLEWGDDARPLADEMVGAPAISADGTRLAFAHRGPTQTDAVSVLDRVELTDRGPVTQRMVSTGAPDRVAISPDGAWVVYVHNATGLASLWAAPFDGGAPVQLTNAGLQRTPGEAPLGFVAPPVDGPPEVSADEVWWTSPDGEHAAVLP